MNMQKNISSIKFLYLYRHNQDLDFHKIYLQFDMFHKKYLDQESKIQFFLKYILKNEKMISYI